MTRNYSVEICGTNVRIDPAGIPERTYLVGVGDFETVVGRNDKAIWQIARHMRIRPEAVLGMLGDAFDESLVNGTVSVEDGHLRFECEFASITLDPGEDGLSWELCYKAKPAMYCENICAHPREVFAVPESLSNGSTFFPVKVLESLIALAEDLSGPPSVELPDKLDRDYRRARRENTYTYDGETMTLTFKTQFWTQDDRQIYATLEPHYDDPIPNTWKLSRIWCAGGSGGTIQRNPQGGL